MVAAIVLVAMDVMTACRSLLGRNANIVSRHWLNVDLTCGYLSIVVRPKGPPKHAMLLRDPDRRVWWFDVESVPEPNGGTARSVAIPLWHLYLPAIAAMAWLERRHARRSRDPHACAACGYNLAGLSPEAVCPECGQRRE